jgi:hypothetical protein
MAEEQPVRQASNGRPAPRAGAGQDSRFDLAHARRFGLVLLFLLYIAGSWYPFRLDLPFRADDVVVDGEVRSFSGRALAAASEPPVWLERAIDDADLRVELEARSTAAAQTGPARLLSITGGVDAQNLVIGQDGEDLVVRVRRGGADHLGEPAFRLARVLQPGRWRTIEVEADADVTVWVDGIIRNYVPDADVFGGWASEHRIALGNEPTWDRGWRGEIRRAEVETAAGRTDLLAGELTSTWDGRWIPPGRLLEDTERSVVSRVTVWGLHLTFSAMAVAAVAFFRRGRPIGLAVRWAALAALVNLGKVVIDTRHPSFTTWVLQTLGGLVAVWLVFRTRADSSWRR